MVGHGLGLLREAMRAGAGSVQAILGLQPCGPLRGSSTHRSGPSNDGGAGHRPRFQMSVWFSPILPVCSRSRSMWLRTSRSRQRSYGRVVIGLLLLLRRAAGAGRVALQMILLKLFACLRWRHLQRSDFTHRDQALWYDTCRQGKRRVQNTFPPYD